MHPGKGEESNEWRSTHLIFQNCSRISHPKIYVFQLSLSHWLPLIQYLTLRSSASLTVQNLHRRSKFTQITGRFGEFFSEKMQVTQKWIEFIGFRCISCTTDIVIYRSLFLLLEDSKKFDTRRLDAIQKEAGLVGEMSSLFQP